MKKSLFAMLVLVAALAAAPVGCSRWNDRDNEDVCTTRISSMPAGAFNPSY